MRTVRNLVGALTVTCGVSLIVYWGVLPREGDGNELEAVSYSQELGQARRAAPFPVVAPVGLPDDWRANSVTYRATGDHGTTWHLGFVTSDDEYVAVEQGSEKPDRFIRSVTQHARPTGDNRPVAGEEWAHYQGKSYDALVLKGEDVTTVVTGTASLEQMEQMAAALKEK
ncbi:DUF4245 domain-containing protein [Streptomyces sp. WMMC500]|uniref:DUF4245 domain-containing protein n=1 Tax=Streptomyces sp. WMMC500 TaxID=3015154 RepID=UPI00248AD55D|nr:DUF4245 domain-containing protein [Streptomyces sp. WMMC500]WBB63428.1 DUF4245 domain-containing protein [Streptomyces sp. WMMC500]